MKKFCKSVTIFILSCVFMSLNFAFADKKPVLVHPIVSYNALYKGETAYDGMVEYYRFDLKESEKSKYPALIKAFTSYNEDSEDFALKDYNETGDDVLFVPSTMQIVRSDSSAFSILSQLYNYSNFQGETFDTSTGKELMISDIVTDMNKFENTLQQIFTKSYGKVSKEEVLDKFYAYRDLNNKPQFNYILGYDYLTLFPRSDEDCDVIVMPFKKYPGLFKDKYTEKPDSYIVPVENIGVDFNLKSIPVCVENSIFTITYNENQTHTLNIDGKNLNFKTPPDFKAKFIEPYIVRIKNKNYLYVVFYNDENETRMSFFDINSNKAERIAPDMNKTFAALEITTETEKTTVDYVAFVDPSEFVTESFMEDLGEVLCIEPYKVSLNGKPEKTTKNYILTSEWKGKWRKDYQDETLRFETLKDLKMKNDKGKTVTVPKGTILMYVETDNKSWAIFELENKSRLRADTHIFKGKDADKSTICGFKIFDALSLLN